jgi:UPF0755 protein
MRLLLAGLGLAVAVVVGAGFYAVHLYDVPGPLAEDRAIVVPRGGIGHVAAVLKEQGVIRDAWQFEAAALATRGAGTLKSAELAFPAAASLKQVLTVLRTSKPIQHKLTIAEGLTTIQVAALFARADALDGEVPAVAEGSVLPETYTYERGTARQMLLGRANRAMDAALDESWSTRAPDLPLATPHDALILASIVERETAKPEERKLVAAVYLNRLRRGMKLQSDPTVVYGVSNGAGVLDHGLTRAELDEDTPYNSYRYAGLPPGPICMPGRAAIDAATHPADSTDLFFVADGTGGHSFAKTEQEHARNVQRWRAAERARRPIP